MNTLEIAEALRDCLCGFLTDSILGPVCRCSLYPSPEIPFDICTRDAHGNGQAAVAFGRQFLTETFPVPSPLTSRNCGFYLAADFTLSVVRCAPVISSTGKLPSASELDAATAAVISDANAARCAVSCCLEGSRQFVISGWTTYPLSGGCMGGELVVTVQTDDIACFQGSS